MLLAVTAVLVVPRWLLPNPVPVFFTQADGTPCRCVFGVVPGQTLTRNVDTIIHDHPAYGESVTSAAGYQSFTRFARRYSVEAYNRPTTTSVSLWTRDDTLLNVGEMLVAYGPPTDIHIYLADVATAPAGYVVLNYPGLMVIFQATDPVISPTARVYYVEFHNGVLNPESPTYLFSSERRYRADWLGLAPLTRYLAHPSLEPLTEVDALPSLN